MVYIKPPLLQNLGARRGFNINGGFNINNGSDNMDLLRDFSILLEYGGFRDFLRSSELFPETQYFIPLKYTY